MQAVEQRVRDVVLLQCSAISHTTSWLGACLAVDLDCSVLDLAMIPSSVYPTKVVEMAMRHLLLLLAQSGMLLCWSFRTGMPPCHSL